MSLSTPRPPLWRRPLYRAVWKAERAVSKRLYLDLAGDHRSTVYIAGGARSGTTWLTELVNYRNEYRCIFEPLSPPRLPEFRSFARGQYLRASDVNPKYREPLTKLVNGRVRNPWSDHFNRNPLARRRLIKDIYANLLLKWLRTNFPQMPIVLLIRHPCAVIASRLALAHRDPWGFAPDLDRFLAQHDLMADLLSPFQNTIEGASTALERHAVWWCIENFVPLRLLSAGEIHVVSYERLRASPDEEIPRMGAFIGRPFDPVVFTRMRRHSLTGPHASLRAGHDPTTDWTTSWSRADVRRVVQILSVFGLDRIYTDQPMPSVQGIADVQADTCSRLQPA